MGRWMAAVGESKGASGFGATAGRAGRGFAGWYTREARALVPGPIAAWLTDTGELRLVIGTQAGPEPGDLTVTLTRFSGARQISTQRIAIDQSGPALAAGIASVRASHGEVALEIAAARCLKRAFDIPREAAPNLPAVLAADIARRTPFAAADVCMATAWRRPQARPASSPSPI